MNRESAIAYASQIESALHIIRGEKVMLDVDLARLYGVSTGALVQAVKRNLSRFPKDFAFLLTAQELAEWKSQIVISNPKAKMGLRKPPYAFTEHGVAMLSSVLRSERAVQVNIEIMRAFVRLRQILAVNTDLARRLDELEKRIGGHDQQFVHVIQAIRQLMQPPASPTKKGRIGFYMPEDEQPAAKADHGLTDRGVASKSARLRRGR
jgi:hypothetical protein